MVGGLGFILHRLSEASPETKQLLQPLLIAALVVAIGFLVVGWAEARSYCDDLRGGYPFGSPAPEYYSEHCNVLFKISP